MQQPAVVEYATPLTRQAQPRLLSLDVFRGLVILAMLIVNNLGDAQTTGYFWKHANWPAMSWGQSWRAWWSGIAGTNEFDDHHVVAVMRRISDDVRASEEQMNRAVIRFNILTRDGLNPDRTALEQEVDAFGIQVALLHDSRNAIVDAERTAQSPWLRLPLFTQCTLADYVMPWFMLIIGVAIPFSVASVMAKGVPRGRIWLRVVRRAALLVALGWILCYFRDQFAPSLYGQTSWRFTLGMDVLQLLGTGYLVARVLYELRATPRALAAGFLLIEHWALLRFYPQGIVPRGTFTQHYNALDFIYDHWNTQNPGPMNISFRGLLSIPPAAATMLIGTLVGDYLRRDDVAPRAKVRKLIAWGAILAVIGFVWAFDLPFNKPCWTPCYLLWCSGVGTILLALLYNVIDVHNVRRWTYPLVVFGVNALALYWGAIMVKVLLLNTPRLGPGHVPLIELILSTFKARMGMSVGGWTFTILFIGFWWVVMDHLYRRKIFLKL